MKMRESKQMGQRGMVSILVTMIMMIVISLIILAITQATRSNQRAQLDNQLSTQAYYAAESGLNQAVKFFTANPTAGINTNNNCTQFITAGGAGGLGQTIGVGNVLDTNTRVSYTCLMVNSTPSSLRKAPLTQEDNVIWKVHNASGQPFTQLIFKWQPNSSSTDTDACNDPAGTFYKHSMWDCRFGLLRVDLIDTHGSVNAGTLQQPAKTLFLQPTYTAGGTTTQTNSATAAQTVFVKCTPGGTCNLALAMPGTSEEYYMRLSLLYQDADSVTLSATEAGGIVTKFTGGQAVIDATGKAGDQLRRVQARVPLSTAGAPMPNFALQTTQDVCKLMRVAPGVATSDGC